MHAFVEDLHHQFIFLHVYYVVSKTPNNTMYMYAILLFGQRLLACSSIIFSSKCYMYMIKCTQNTLYSAVNTTAIAYACRHTLISGVSTCIIKHPSPSSSQLVQWTISSLTLGKIAQNKTAVTYKTESFVYIDLYINCVWNKADWSVHSFHQQIVVSYFCIAFYFQLVIKLRM